MREVIQGLWIGSALSAMEITCLQSYYDHGHEFHLYSYHPINDVPKTVIQKEANDIIPYEQLPYTQFASLAAFSDFFRYKLLYEKGGYYVDMDTVCLREFDFDYDHVFASEDTLPTRNSTGTLGSEPHPTGSFIRAPCRSDVMRWCWDECMKVAPAEAQRPWGRVGPQLLKRAIENFSLQARVELPSVFCPVPWWQVDRFIFEDISACIRGSYGVHLWSEMWKRRGINRGNIDAKSWYGQLQHKYIIAA